MDTVKSQANIWFVAAWFGASATTLIFSLIFTLYISGTKIVKPEIQNFQLYAALPATEGFISDEISHADGRAKIIEDFFKGYKAPLSDASETFIEVADKYQLDYRLLPAIAMQESNGGKRVIKDSYNPFGYGIYGKLVVRFNSWEEAIERVGRALREDYLNKGLKNPTQIMAKYTPPSLAIGGTWAKGVNTFMEELR
ncbi:MAG: glucosaminidase domain-containing protein [Candidatus Daviesbacteria bacterium]|nr:glucosaminidase domain-containing protein [Candidatus Daviesbacteria bacterium]